MKKFFLYIIILIIFSGELIYSSNAKILLVNPAATESVFKKINKPFQSYFEEWKNLLFRSGYEFDITKDTDIASNLDENHSVIIAFDVVCLNKSAFKEIEKFILKGGNIILNGEFGCFDLSGLPQEEELFQSIFKFKYYKNDFRPGMKYLFSVKGKSPLSSGLEFGHMTNFNNNFIPLTIFSSEINLEEIAYWQTNIEIFQGFNPFSKFPGIIKGKIEQGNFYWFGFQTYNPLQSSNNAQNLGKIYLNALKDLMLEPVIKISPWPDSKNSAVSIQLESYDRDLISTFQKNNIDFDFIVTHFSDSKTGVKNFKNLSLDLSNKFINSEKFETTISSYNNFFESSFGKKINTVFLNSSLLNPGNVEILEDAGFEAIYCGCKNLLNENYKSIIEGSLVLTPLKIDESNLAKDFSLNDCSDSFPYVSNLYNKIVEESLYFNYSVSTNQFKICDYKTEILNAISYFNQNNSWITSSKEIFRRLSAYKDLKFSVIRQNHSRYVVTIRNIGKHSIDDLTLISNEALNFFSIKDNFKIKRDFIESSKQRIIVLKSIGIGDTIELIFEKSGNY